MLNLTFPVKINPIAFEKLSTRKKHLFTEQKMGDRIRLPYDQALKACKHAINSDEKLIKAFQNFQKNKDLQFNEISEEVLLAAFVDKFKEKIFFVSFNGGNILNDLNYFVYDIPSNHLSGYSNNDQHSEPSNFARIRFYPRGSRTINDCSSKAALTHIIYNENSNCNDSSKNQEYVSDEHYREVTKLFGSIDDFGPLYEYNNTAEVNDLTSGKCISRFNPAHTILDLDKLLEKQFRRKKSIEKKILILNLIINNQGLTQSEFNKLTTKEKHAYTEIKMGDRIRISYNEALKACRYAINSNEMLNKAFQNFQNNKNLQHDEVTGEILTGAFVDKFKEKIFFIVSKNGLVRSHLVYDIPLRQLSIYSYQHWPEKNRHSDLQNIKEVQVLFHGIIEKIWRKNSLVHYIRNKKAPNKNFNTNQEYVSDNHYYNITKFFKPLTEMNEINSFSSKCFHSSFNPAHTTLDPDDLINEKN